jgi:alpha-beta hydrolase superfamily lysophospholipase
MDTVTSQDGTKIAFERTGSGPAVIVVGGAFTDRAAGATLAAELSKQGFTVFTYDRRGRGDSGDTPPYAVEREIEDLEALVTAAGGEAFAVGFSSGAALILEATAAGVAFDKVALFEPPYVGDSDGLPRPIDLVSKIVELTSSGRRGEAVAVFMTEAVGQSPEEVDFMRSQPMWPALEAISHTVAYDFTIMGDAEVPAERAAAVKIPALLIDSSGTIERLSRATQATAQALPDARRITLEGGFHEVPPETLAPALKEFFA